MAACSDRAAAWTSGFEETDMTTTAAPQARSFREPRPCRPHLHRLVAAAAANALASQQIAGNFQSFLTPADDAIAEPESARSAGHQPVHPAARRIRRRPAAAQHQRLAGDAGIAAADRAIDPGAGICRQDRGGQWQHRRADQQRQREHGELNVPSASNVNDHHRQQHRSDRLLAAPTTSPPATTSRSHGTARAMTAPSGPTAITP